MQLEKSALKAGLQYIDSRQPGYLRVRAGKGFYYTFKDKRVRNPLVLKRIRELVIPPAWESVWICRNKNGHLQVTGKDVKGRKQYRYHPQWNQIRNETKFSSLLKFGEALPKIRKTLQKDIQRRRLEKEKVVAAVLMVMQETCILVGNDVYAKENGSFGLTTLLNKHVQVKGSSVQFHFRGKSGVLHHSSLQDKKLSDIIRRCQDLPGKELFAYLDESGGVQDLTSTDINDYLKQVSDAPLTAKDFRTWSGTVLALEEIVQCGPLEKYSKQALKKRQVAVIQKVAERLRNTVAVCRKYYVHPTIFEKDEKGVICALMSKSTKRSSRYLSAHESLLIELLKKSGK